MPPTDQQAPPVKLSDSRAVRDMLRSQIRPFKLAVAETRAKFEAAKGTDNEVLEKLDQIFEAEMANAVVLSVLLGGVVNLVDKHAQDANETATGIVLANSFGGRS
jgi:hypothetical protein